MTRRAAGKAKRKKEKKFGVGEKEEILRNSGVEYEKEQKQKKKVVHMRDILHDGVSYKENQTGRFHGE